MGEVEGKNPAAGPVAPAYAKKKAISGRTTEPRDAAAARASNVQAVGTRRCESGSERC
jgi:hypothetical protein